MLQPVLVTGASGFIGSALVSRLRSLGHAVLTPSSRELDLTHWPAVEAFLAKEQPGTVFHLAADTAGRKGVAELRRACLVNTMGCVHLLQAGLQSGLKRLVMTGTGDENSPTPSAYAASKAAATLFARSVSAQSALKVTVLRLYAVYGPGQNEGFLIPQLLAAVKSGQPLPMTSGTQSRDFVWLEDVVSALCAVAVCDGAQDRVLDVCRGESHTLRELVALLERLSGVRPLALFGERPQRGTEPHLLQPDPGPLRDLIGDVMPTSLEEGLARLLKSCCPRSS